MVRSRATTNLGVKEVAMGGVFGTLIVFLFVAAVLATVAYALFEMSPFARHEDQYRDLVTRRRLGVSPHLETRDEFERHELGG
jgi:uncharacterized membrane protein